MTDKVYPSATKPNGTTTTTPANNNPLPIPPAKTHLYNPNRHPYRQQPPRHTRRSRRSWFCCCCFWSILLIFLILVAATIAGAAAYSIYRPHRPTFSFTSLKISQFNLTTAAADESTRLTTKLNITLSSTNPNKKLIFIYDPIQITALSSTQEVEIGNGSFSSFTSTPKNITYIHTSLYSHSQVLDADSVNSLRSDLKKKSGLPLKILLDTRVIVKADNLRSKKLGIRIKCEGVHATSPKGKSVSVASVSKAKCKVDLRVKIWKWTF